MVKSFGGIMAMLLCAIGAMPVHAAPAPAWHPTHAWFAQYVAAFNSQNPKLFTSEFFSPNIIFHRNNNRDTHGRDAYVAEYIGMHDGLREILHPQKVVIDGDLVAAELNVEFRATKDQPHFILRPVKAGDVFIVKMFVFYETKDGKIQSITDAHWTPGVQ
jgi:hypothetical protein